MPKYDWFDISNLNREDWEKFCPPGNFRLVTKKEFQEHFPEPLSPRLTNKYANVLITGSPTQNGVIYMANGNRVDQPPNEIDQMPLGIIFLDNTTSGSAVLIQHGDWDGRSTEIPDGFLTKWDLGLLDDIYFPIEGMPDKSSGKLEELNSLSQVSALQRIVSILRDGEINP